MIKECQEISHQLAQAYEKARPLKKIPRLKLQASQGNLEEFAAKYAAGVLSIESSTAIGHAYGISQMGVAAKAGHLGDYLGNVQPKFALRPLWLDDESEVEVSKLVTLHLPTFMLNPQVEAWVPNTARRLIELGYNALLLGARKNSMSTREICKNVDLQKIVKMFSLYGIKVILKPNFRLFELEDEARCPLDEDFRNALRKAMTDFYAMIPDCKTLFWESMLQSPRYRYHSKAKELTLAEIIIQEVHLLEKCQTIKGDSAARELIFYLPCLNTSQGQVLKDWIPILLDEMGVKTTFAFSAVKGDVCQDHLPDHPLWKLLRQSPDCSTTPLLPIINFGAVEQGEGLWPATNFDLIDRFLPKCRRHPFAGVIGVVNHLPQEGSLLDCLLWVAGQSLWRYHSTELLAETWFEAFRHEKDVVNVALSLKGVRHLILELSLLRSLVNNDERRRIGEPLIPQLKSLIYFFEKNAWAAERSSLKEYFNLFVCDIKRFLEQSLQLSCRVASPSYGEEQQQSFWTHPKGRGEFLVRPQEGLPGSVMEAIYKENRYL